MKLLKPHYLQNLSLLKSAIISFIYPNQCLICEETIDEESVFCSKHLKEVKFSDPSKCQICSRSLQKQESDKIQCLDCLKNSPPYDSSAILFSYEKTISNLILSFKYNDNTYICKKLGKLFAKQLIQEQEDFQIITAVPLHKKRIKTRKYNQSIVLGRHIASNLKNIKFIPDLLIRIKFNKTQEKLNESQRKENLKNTFEVNKKYTDLIKGQNIILVDDVVTTGATLEECSRALKTSGVDKVKIAAIAKTKMKKI